MGYDIHITRHEDWSEEGGGISKQEWDTFVESASVFSYSEQIGEGMYIYRWDVDSPYPEPWLMWFEGCLSTKNPHREMIIKMIELAEQLDALVIGDDGERYTIVDGQLTLGGLEPSELKLPKLITWLLDKFKK